jgi:hypothetical protein
MVGERRKAMRITREGQLVTLINERVEKWMLIVVRKPILFAR